MTKRITMFLALAFVCLGVSTQASGQGKHVLIEEFTSSTCPPCAVTDPVVRQVVGDKHDAITIIRWHQNYPEPGDPSYILYPAGATRGYYYNVPGIPAASINGGATFNPGEGATTFEAQIDAALAAMPDYYTMSVKQSIVGDSIIAMVTVKSGAAVPDTTALRMGVAICERYAVYQGSNGLPVHDYMGRQMLPGLTPFVNQSTDPGGKLPDAAAFSQAANTTKTYRYAAKIKTGWNPSMLNVVAFIQNAQDVSSATKDVYASSWTENLNVDVTPNNSAGMLVGDGTTLDFNITNNSSAEQKLAVALLTPSSLAMTPLTLKGADLKADGSITIPANTSSMVSVVAPASGPFTGWGNIGLTVRTADSVGVSGGWGLTIGKDVKTLILDNGAGWEGMGPAQTNPPNMQKSLTNLNIPSAVVRYERMTEAFQDDWSNFKNVVIDAGWYYYGFLNGDSWTMPNTTALLARGGNVLWVSGEFPVILERAGGLYAKFVQDNFHTDSVKVLTGVYTKVDGVMGDPISSGLTNITINGQQNALTVKAHDANGFPIFKIGGKADVVGMRAIVGTGKSVWLPFEPGNITPTASRDTIIRRIFRWFDPTAAVNTPVLEKQNGLSTSQNPFTTSTNVSYVGGTNEVNVTMSVVDLLGREVMKLAPVRSNSNTYSATIYGAHLATGVYHVVVHSTAGMKQIPVMIAR